MIEGELTIMNIKYLLLMKERDLPKTILTEKRTCRGDTDLPEAQEVEATLRKDQEDMVMRGDLRGMTSMRDSGKEGLTDLKEWRDMTGLKDLTEMKSQREEKGMKMIDHQGMIDTKTLSAEVTTITEAVSEVVIVVTSEEATEVASEAEIEVVSEEEAGEISEVEEEASEEVETEKRMMCLIPTNTTLKSLKKLPKTSCNLVV